MNTTMRPGALSSDAPTGGTGAPTKIAVWDLPTRVFHWSLVLSFAGAFITGDSERWQDLHLIFGYTLMGLIVFRLVWGIVGSRYARFASFVTGPGKVFGYLSSLLTKKPEHHVGHNPAGAMAIVLLLALGLVNALTGLATFNEFGGEWLEEVHEWAANAMLAVVGVHVAGVVVSSFLHRENLVGAMLTGKKQGQPGQGIASTHRLVGVALLAALIATWSAWAIQGPGFLPGLGDATAQRPDRDERGWGDDDHERKRDKHDRRRGKDDD